jgi:amino acid transporter
VVITMVGLGVGKWLHKASGVLMIGTFAVIVALPLLQRGRGLAMPYEALPLAAPALSVMTLNLLGKMGFGALGGFEYVAIHAGESRDPARSIARSVMVAAPVIAAMFILGTSSVLALVPIDRIDLIAPIPQVLSVGFAPLGVPAVAPLAIVALLLIRIGQSSVMFAGNTRLPMVAGWDDLLPLWFTRLHTRWRTPVNSIVFVGAATLVLAIAGLAGVGKQEAFQLLWNASGVFYALTYVLMFALPLVGLRGRPAAPWWLRACALSGLLMTLLFLALSIVPIVRVESRLLFALKISGLVALTNAIGLLIYFGAARRAASAR